MRGMGPSIYHNELIKSKASTIQGSVNGSFGVSMLVVLPILGNPEVLQYQANHQQPNALREALFCMNVILWTKMEKNSFMT